MTFADAFLLLLIWVPLAILWVFALVDLFKRRRFMSGPAIAGWLALLVFLPVVGVIAYFVGRRSNEQEAARRGHGEPDPRMTPEVSAEMDRIAALYRKGAINAYEREQAEAKLLHRDWFGG